MFVQIFLGGWMFVIGVCHFLKVKFFLRKSVINTLDKDELASYQKGLIIPYLLMGTTFIIMGILERGGSLSMPVFLGIYIILGVISLALVLINNKKHTGYYFW